MITDADSLPKPKLVHRKVHFSPSTLRTEISESKKSISKRFWENFFASKWAEIPISARLVTVKETKANKNILIKDVSAKFGIMIGAEKENMMLASPYT